MAHSLCMHHIIKQIARQQSITDQDIFTSKLDNSENSTILCFFAHLHFKSILSSNTHS